ncbi:family 16 glycoside hydrolase [Zobellia roscoffensis]|uniref:family 16 glycoside hydrolase n=1 Tax=Zobellia roscoffensis TaxID=2779508 RepID=UPI001889C61E|nr:family 16 glycoside hydrolase [Zobellia roscoffensis]
MKRTVPIFILSALLYSCTEKERKVEVAESAPQEISLPFECISLNDFDDFKKTSSNWSIGGDVYVDRLKDKQITVSDGSGVLVNIPDSEYKDHIFTNFEHGDIELEVDVMMPKGSNSGLYFQGRYEVQLFDSWKVEEATFSDMGGIYQRWDASKEKGSEGYEGTAPSMNAAKAPGLWQHVKVVFHAPQFDASGQKVKDAEFAEVRLNGVLIHENVQVSGPTRAAITNDEVVKAPLMIQGDHGAVAFKNFSYKLYGNPRLSFVDLKMKEFKSKVDKLPNVDTLTPIREITTDTISATMAEGDKVTRILDYRGKLLVPVSGDYLFDFRLNQAGGLLMINNDTVVNRDGNFIVDTLGLAKVSLSKGEVPFRLIYNKHNPWVIGFSLYVEGPGVEKQALHAASSLNEKQGALNRKIMVEPTDKAVMQRSFLMHSDEKRTHCISVGTPQKINYAYDLASGCLLEVWSGDFLDATQMWHARGIRQLGDPVGFAVSFHGTPEFSSLASGGSDWPNTVTEEGLQFSEGYELDKNGIPLFIRNLESKIIKDKMEPSLNERKLNRTISFSGEGEIWHKVASGEAIEKLPDGSYIVNNESYFVVFSDDSLAPIIRKSNGTDELLVKIPTGEQKVEYSIIW